MENIHLSTLKKVKSVHVFDSIHLYKKHVHNKQSDWSIPVQYHISSNFGQYPCCMVNTDQYPTRKFSRLSCRYFILKHDQVGFFVLFRCLSDELKLSRTIECFKIWQWLLNIVPAEIAVNVLIGCLYIGMRDYIYSPRDYIYNPASVN